MRGAAVRKALGTLEALEVRVPGADRGPHADDEILADLPIHDALHEAHGKEARSLRALRSDVGKRRLNRRKLLEKELDLQSCDPFLMAQGEKRSRIRQRHIIKIVHLARARGHSMYM